MYTNILAPPPRHANQTAANHAFNLRCARRSARLHLILHITRCTWRCLGFLYRLRRPARHRHIHQSYISQLISSPPTPMLGYDLGYSDVTNDLVLRSPTGNFTTHHPSNPNIALLSIPAYSSAGSSISPLIPPAESRLVLCPELSGSWCYYHVNFGTTTWDLPSDIAASSIPLASASPSSAILPTLTSFVADHPPPHMDCRLTLDTLDRHTSWLPLFHDHNHIITLYNKMTGCTRSAPWLTLRDHGRIYFANIVSGYTRWAPPLQWLDDWISRTCPFDRRSLYARSLLPASLARMHVEGGAPYLDSCGSPQYVSDSSDTADSYPM